MEDSFTSSLVVLFRRSWTRGTLLPNAFRPIVLPHTKDHYKWPDGVMVSLNTEPEPPMESFCVLPTICADPVASYWKPDSDANLKLCVMLYITSPPMGIAASIALNLVANLNRCLVTMVVGSIPNHSGPCQIIELLD